MHFKRISLFIFLSCSLVTNLAFSAAIMEKIINTDLKGSSESQIDIYKKLFNKAFKEKNEEKAVSYFMKIFSTYAESRGSHSPDMLGALEYSSKFIASYERKNPKLLKKISDKCEDFVRLLPGLLNLNSDKKKKKNKKYTIDAYRRTELQNLVRAGNLKGVQSTLASNCSAEYFNMQAGERKIHVLHYAAGRVNLENGFEIAKLLITYAVSKGYDLNVKTLNGRTPLDVARDHEHTELIELLEQEIERIKNEKNKI